jgi:hypothetical protein
MDKENAMDAGDIINIIITVISLSKPLLDLITTLQKYVENYRSEIAINYGKEKTVILKATKKTARYTIKKIIKNLF